MAMSIAPRYELRINHSYIFLHGDDCYCDDDDDDGDEGGKDYGGGDDDDDIDDDDFLLSRLWKKWPRGTMERSFALERVTLVILVTSSRLSSHNQKLYMSYKNLLAPMAQRSVSF